MKNKCIIGLTGPSGSGKTIVTQQLITNGFSAIDCDKVAHEVTTHEEPLAALVKLFGTGIQGENNALDRRALGEIVFSDEKALSALNETILPFIIKEIKILVTKMEAYYVVLDAPTLIESKLSDDCDLIVTVTSKKSNRLMRILERDQISEEKAVARITAQPNEAFYVRQSTLTLINDGTLNEIIERADHLVNFILATFPQTIA